MKATVSISRDSRDNVRIRIKDSASRIEFADVSMTVEAFGYAITGLSEQEGDLIVRMLEHVGKTKVTEHREIECPLRTFDKNLLSDWLVENAQEEGWILNTYLGSQSSVSIVGEKIRLRYSVTKYVDDSQPKES